MSAVVVCTDRRGCSWLRLTDLATSSFSSSTWVSRLPSSRFVKALVTDTTCDLHRRLSKKCGLRQPLLRLSRLDSFYSIAFLQHISSPLRLSPSLSPFSLFVSRRSRLFAGMRQQRRQRSSTFLSPNNSHQGL